MRKIAASVLLLMALAAASSAQARVTKMSGPWQLRTASKTRVIARAQMLRTTSAFQLRTPAAPAAPSAPTAVLSAYEAGIVARINGVRTARGLRALRVSRGLSAAAAYHSNQMGLRGFFEHESVNGAPFWRRIERFYPARRGRSWSVGENILWGSPDISASGAIRSWMNSPPHRENMLSREWLEIGIGAVHFNSAPGAFGGRPVTIVTADFGRR